MRVILLTLAALSVMAAPAAAQSQFGDVQMSYSNGVVYDDDLVPGRAQNSPYHLGGGESVTVGEYYDTPTTRTVTRRTVRRVDSPNLIGRGGRAIPE